MELRPKMPPYMRRYMVRVMMFMAAYVVILTSSLTFARGPTDHSQATLIGLAVITALPVVGVFWAIFRLLIETDDEYQRFLFAKQILLGTAITLVVVTVWQFLEVYDVVDSGPQWMAAIWFASFGLAGPVARWNA